MWEYWFPVIPTFSRIKQNLQFCPYTEKYGSAKARIVTYFTHRLQPYPWMTAVKFVEYKESIKKCTTN